MAGWSSTEPFLVAQRGPAGPDYRMGLIFCYLFFYCFWATTAHRCLCSLSILHPCHADTLHGRAAPWLTLGQGFSWLPSHSLGSGRWGIAVPGRAVEPWGTATVLAVLCHPSPAPVLREPKDHGIIQAGNALQIIVFSCSSSTAEGTTNPVPVPMCHIYTALQSLQLWG